MELSISNLTWEVNEDEAVKDILISLNVNNIEIALTKIWSNPLDAKEAEIKKYREYWDANGINIVALQSLLFGRPDLEMFSDTTKRQEMLEYLSKIIELGAGLGAKAFVFGSPKNRLVGELNYSKAMEIAIEFFYKLGEKAHMHNTVFCIEPNPKVYNCDFITTTEEGINLVKEVNHPGFGLHLDAAGMTLSNENIEESIERSASYLTHFHISEPQLNMVQNGQVDHKTFSRLLKEINYANYISIEMKPGLINSNTETVKKSLEFVLREYF